MDGRTDSADVLEINPRSGPPDVCIAAEKTGECWLAPLPEHITDWEPSSHLETSFSLFLLSARGDVLFEAVCDTSEKLTEHTEQVRKGLEPLADSTTQRPSTNGCDAQEEMRALNTLAKSLLAARMLAPESSIQLGRLEVDAETVQLLTQEVIDRAINRHARGDWGMLTLECWQINDRAARKGGLLTSAFRADEGIDFEVITLADCSVTTVCVIEKEDGE